MAVPPSTTMAIGTPRSSVFTAPSAGRGRRSVGTWRCFVSHRRAVMLPSRDRACDVELFDGDAGDLGVLFEHPDEGEPLGRGRSTADGEEEPRHGRVDDPGAGDTEMAGAGCRELAGEVEYVVGGTVTMNVDHDGEVVATGSAASRM